MLIYKTYIRLIKFKDLVIPKYKQLAFAIAEDIQHGKLDFLDYLPSISDYAGLINISKKTVAKAYHLLKKKGIVDRNASRRYIVKDVRVVKLLVS